MPLQLQILVREITEITARRFRLIQHIIQMHDGDVFWLNIIFLEKSQMDAYFNTKTFHHKIHTYHVLGHALSSLIPPVESEGLDEYLKNYLAILNNWEMAITQDIGTWTPRMKAFFSTRGFRKSSLGIEGRSLDENENVKPLILPHLPFTPSYTQTVLVLCDLLRETYTIMASFISSSTGYSRFIETFYRVDHKVKKILEAMAKEMEIYARSTILKEFNHLSWFPDHINNITTFET
ncbi:hypothetical protein PCANB_000323 [Pneumocystis canis]|nr:hypothetical protein PCK1_000319 [Pneumocystis canis]KAG5437977.1 hypothetical protein PCANB_000323 [Pneumocystis canis]